MPDDQNQNQQSDNTSGEQNQSQNQNPSVPQEGDGNPPSWREALPADLKSEKTFEKFNDVPSLAKSYLEAQKAISKKRVIIPSDKATPEEWNNYYRSLGRPDTPEGYTLNNEGITVDENMKKFAISVFHEAGLNNKQAEIINSKWNALQQEQAAAREAQINEVVGKVTAEFKKEWGNNFETNLKKADEIGQRVFGKGFMDALKETGLNNHPEVIRGLHKLSTVVGEHSFTTGNSNKATQPTVTFEKLLSMKSDPRYWDSGRRDPAFVKEVEEANRAYSASKGA